MTYSLHKKVLKAITICIESCAYTLLAANCCRLLYYLAALPCIFAQNVRKIAFPAIFCHKNLQISSFFRTFAPDRCLLMLFRLSGTSQIICSWSCIIDKNLRNMFSPERIFRKWFLPTHTITYSIHKREQQLLTLVVVLHIIRNDRTYLDRKNHAQSRHTERLSRHFPQKIQKLSLFS